MSYPATDHFRVLDIPRAIWFFVAQDRVRYLVFTSLLFLSLFYTLVPPFLIGKTVDYLVRFHPGDSLQPIYLYVGGLTISSALVAISRISCKRIIGQISINARYRARVWGFERLLDFSLAWHQQENTGNKAQRIITGADSIREWTRDIGNKIFPTLTNFIGATLACMWVNPWFGLFFIYYIAGLVLAERYFDSRIARLSDQINKSIENASGSLVESASNILAVKALGAQQSMTNKVEAREEIARKLAHERLRLGNTKWMVFQVHNSLAWGIFVLFVALAVVHGKLSVGLVLTYTAYFGALRESATEFTDHIQTMIEQKSNLGRLMPIFWGDHRLKTGEAPFPQDWRAIELNNVRFRYQDNDALTGINLSIRHGEKIGIAGHSGSGKSTLIKLLLGLYHVEDGTLSIGSEPLQAIRHEALTAQMSVVLQETELFNLSLRENISMLRDVDATLFAKACRIACLDELIARLPEGINTLIGERGYSLSGGERQRVGIARAICRDTPILLLDEATSALDSNTEHRVMAGLLTECADDKTMLIVAHRISTLKDADRILVFEKGTIIEEGSFTALSRDPSTRFGAMYSMQAA